MIVGQGVYRDGKRLDVDGSFLDLVNTCRTGDEFVWLGLFEPSLEELDQAAEAFGIHPLAIEEHASQAQRRLSPAAHRCLAIEFRRAREVGLNPHTEFQPAGEGYGSIRIAIAHPLLQRWQRLCGAHS